MDLVTTILTSSSIMLLSFIFIQYNHQKKKLTDLPPGNLGWPVVGETIDFIVSARNGYLYRFILDRMKQYSQYVFKTSVLGEEMAFVCDPSGFKFFFSLDSKKLVRPWMPHSLVQAIMPNLDYSKTDPNKESLRRIRIFAESLKPEVVQKYVERMDSAMRKHMASESWAPSSNIKVFPLVRKLTCSLAFSLFLGIDNDTNPIANTLDQKLMAIFTSFITVPIDLPGMPVRLARKAADSIRCELRNLLVEKRSGGVNGINFMSQLLTATDDDGKLLSDEEITDLMMGILLASNETTSSLFTSLVYYLAHHPHVYALALKEQLEIRSSKGGENLLAWEDTKRMKYCRNVINEVLRLSPPGVGVFREAMDDIPYQGFTIPKGWKLFYSLQSTHKNPKYFPDPEKFNPTRFDGNGHAPHTFSPFGGGPHMCPGQEFVRQGSLVFLHNLLLSFKWEKLIADEKIICVPLSTPSQGLPVKLERRVDDDADTQ